MMICKVYVSNWFWKKQRQLQISYVYPKKLFLNKINRYTRLKTFISPQKQKLFYLPKKSNPFKWKNVLYLSKTKKFSSKISSVFCSEEKLVSSSRKSELKYEPANFRCSYIYLTSNKNMSMQQKKVIKNSYMFHLSEGLHNQILFIMFKKIFILVVSIVSFFSFLLLWKDFSSSQKPFFAPVHRSFGNILLMNL